MTKKTKAKPQAKPAIEGRIVKPSAATRTAKAKNEAMAKAKGENRTAAALRAVETMVEDDAPAPTLPGAGAALPANNNVVPMTGTKATAKQESGNSKLVDYAVDGGMLLDPATQGNKTSAQLYKPEPKHIDNVMRLAAMDGSAFNAELEKLGSDVTTLQFRIALHMVVIAYRLQKDGQDAMEYLHNFMESMAKLGKGTSLVRTDAIKTWFLKYSATAWEAAPGSDAKGFVFSKDAKSKMAGEFGNNRKGWVSNRLAKPFWIVTPEPKFQEFSFAAALAQLMKRAATYEEMLGKPDELKAKFGVDDKGNAKLPDLTGLAEIRKAIKKAHLDKVEAKDTENKETAAA